VIVVGDPVLALLPAAFIARFARNPGRMRPGLQKEK
jgi:hypothetical protein